MTYIGPERQLTGNTDPAYTVIDGELVHQDHLTRALSRLVNLVLDHDSTLDHEYGADGYCIFCGSPDPVGWIASRLPRVVVKGGTMTVSLEEPNPREESEPRYEPTTSRELHERTTDSNGKAKRY